MGMVFVARALTQQLAEAVTADQELLDRLMFGDEDDAGVDDASQEPGGQDLSHIDLDKSWHGIHFLLTRTVWDTTAPLGLAILGGREIGQDSGYGPARLLEPGQVRLVADALARVDAGKLRHSYDPHELEQAEIYPAGIWDEPGIVDEYLMPSLRKLSLFYANAAATGSAVLLALT